MTDAPITRFVEPTYPRGRILLMSGQVDVGAVFPPCGQPPNQWAWRLWITPDTQARDGRAKSEQAAKSALLLAWRSFLERAELKEDMP
jgi:hypothetical protein